MASKSPTKSNSSSKLAKSSSSSNISDKKEGRSKDSRSRNRDKGDSDQDEKEGALAYKVLSEQKTKDLLELETVEEVQSKLVEILELGHHEIDLKEAAVLDYYVSASWWGKEQNFTVQQQSGLFTVIHTLLENVKEKHMSVVDNLAEYKKMLVGIGLDSGEMDERPVSGGLNFFDVTQAQALSDYLYSSLFQHYKMYEYMFTTTQAEEIIGTDLDIEVAKPADMPWPPPLDDGLAEDTYNTFIMQPTPPPTAMTNHESTAEGDTEQAETGEVEGASVSGEAPEEDRLSLLLAEVTEDEIKTIMDTLAKDLFTGLTTDVATKLREKENVFINRINKIHKVADS